MLGGHDGQWLRVTHLQQSGDELILPATLGFALVVVAFGTRRLPGSAIRNASVRSGPDEPGWLARLLAMIRPGPRVPVLAGVWARTDWNTLAPARQWNPR